MPSTPEISGVNGKIRIVKVGRVCEPKDPGAADSHVAISREVAVKLDAESQCGKDYAQGIIISRMRKNTICIRSDVVRQDHFFYQSNSYQRYAVFEVLRGYLQMSLIIQLSEKIPGTYYGS